MDLIPSSTLKNYTKHPVECLGSGSKSAQLIYDDPDPDSVLRLQTLTAETATSLHSIKQH